MLFIWGKSGIEGKEIDIQKLSKMRDFTYNTETYDRSKFSQI